MDHFISSSPHTLVASIQLIECGLYSPLRLACLLVAIFRNLRPAESQNAFEGVVPSDLGLIRKCCMYHFCQRWRKLAFLSTAEEVSHISMVGGREPW